mgnify:FL=1
MGSEMCIRDRYRRDRRRQRRPCPKRRPRPRIRRAPRAHHTRARTRRSSHPQATFPQGIAYRRHLHPLRTRPPIRRPLHPRHRRRHSRETARRARHLLPSPARYPGRAGVVIDAWGRRSSAVGAPFGCLSHAVESPLNRRARGACSPVCPNMIYLTFPRFHARRGRFVTSPRLNPAPIAPPAPLRPLFPQANEGERDTITKLR